MGKRTPEFNNDSDDNCDFRRTYFCVYFIFTLIEHVHVSHGDGYINNHSHALGMYENEQFKSANKFKKYEIFKRVLPSTN